jgi:CheY-like chemotaxis protein
MTSATKSVLVVDDDFGIRDNLTDALTDEGYSVATAADGVEALDYLRTHEPPGLILLDWMMPRCDGAQFRAQQRQDPVLASIPVVLLTADAKIQDKVVSLEAEGFLTKPVQLSKLLDTVGRYCK